MLKLEKRSIEAKNVLDRMLKEGVIRLTQSPFDNTTVWISSCGTTVISYKYNKKILKFIYRMTLPSRARDGYKMFGFNKDGERKIEYVHRLVGKAWVDNPNNYNEINHIDSDKFNNHYTNLEWCTHKYNIQCGNPFGGINGHPNKPIMDNNGNVYKSIATAARKLGLRNSAISHVLAGVGKTVKGFSFRLLTEEEIKLHGIEIKYVHPRINDV